MRLIEVLLATALFVFVAFAGLESLRGIGAGVNLLAARAESRAQSAAAVAALRSEALAAVAVWKPASACGDALAFMRRDASGTAFALYELRGSAFVRVRGPGPIAPCDATLPAETLIANAAAFTVTPVVAAALPAHADALTGAADGAMLLAPGITSVSVDAHARDADGTPIRTGNAMVEAALDAGPALAIVDLAPGNRPSGYTQVLAYACAGRCAANVPFPEIRGADAMACTAAIDFQNAPAYYVAATVATNAAGAVRVTSYWVTGAYAFAFGPAGATARRTWTPALWPPSGALVDDPYPVDYAASAIALRAPAQIASDIGAAAAYAGELAACNALNADVYFHG